MIEMQCKWCGKTMKFRQRIDVRKFCSRQCSRANKIRKMTAEDDANVIMPPLEHLTDDGFMALVEAIVAQAKTDVMNNEPGNPIREDAEAFFMSENFYELTNLDGFDLLCRIQDEYDEKQRKKEERKAHAGRV